MVEQLKIYVENLKDGHKEKIETTLSPDFLDLHEEELQTPSVITVKGEAYCLDDFLMISLHISTEIEMPCSICNRVTRIHLQNENIYFSISLSELSSLIFDYTQQLREEILILIPPLTECNQGVCPERQSLYPYLKSTDNSNTSNFPFADL